MLLSFSAPLREQAWLALNPMPHSLLPKPWRSWLLDKGSLTLNLKSIAPGRFSVKVLDTHFGRASLSEANALSIPIRQMVYVREVALCIDTIPVVLARSVIPKSTLTGSERQLLFLKNKPLGEYLFKHKHMIRSPIEIKKGLVNGETVWGRRSIFKLNNKSLLVSEYFLTSLFTMNN